MNIISSSKNGIYTPILQMPLAHEYFTTQIVSAVHRQVSAAIDPPSFLSMESFWDFLKVEVYPLHPVFWRGW